ncbi:NACHT domain- and WD repeat-containing protein 1 [Branchiostoma belcheri]|nr:NACHT domain- and WD repeat-containing protein 1 [Branchiostoma belcheri]
MLVRPFLPAMTNSELFTVMTAGFSSIAGSVLAAFTSLGISASFLLTANVMAAPTSLALSKLVYPETDTRRHGNKKDDRLDVEIPKDRNLLEAASAGASMGVSIVANIVGNLISFISLLAFINTVLTWLGGMVNIQDLTFQAWGVHRNVSQLLFVDMPTFLETLGRTCLPDALCALSVTPGITICSYVFMPLAFLAGVPWEDCRVVAELFGTKTFLNEFVAYVDMSNIIKGRVPGKTLQCGDPAGRDGDHGPGRRGDLADLALRSMLTGAVVGLLNACMAGLLYQDPVLSTVSTLNGTSLLNSTQSCQYTGTLLDWHKIGGMSGLEPGTSRLRVEHSAATPHDPTKPWLNGLFDSGTLPTPEPARGYISDGHRRNWDRSLTGSTSTQLIHEQVHPTVKPTYRRGRQKKVWLDNIKDWTSLTVPQLLTAAQDRRTWLHSCCKVCLVPRRPVILIEGLYRTALNMMEVTTEMRAALMEGHMTALPPDKSNIVRIFMSSTFSDMAKERNILLQKAYPELREFCQKQGLDFQVMDMRWGVRDEVVADHMTCALCLMEIDTCKRLSVGPNFVAFLGNRYGYRPIPAKIEAEELDILLQKAGQLEMDTAVITEWYLKDDNAVPAVCLLQPITSKFKHYTDMEPANQSLRQKDKQGWYQVITQLENILRTAVKAAHEEGQVTEEQQHKYIKSVTEIEIKRGIFESTNANQRAVIFMRNLQNIEKHVGADAGEAERRVPEPAGGPEGKLPSKLKNVHQYEVEWTDKGVNEDVESHASYLEQFSDDFVADLKSMILKSLQSESEQEQNDDWFLTEVISHARFCQAKCESFCGRQEIFDAVYTYMKDTAKVNHQPFVIHGASGSGKSSIMAMLAQNAAQRFGENLVTIIRFLGTSLHSTLIHPVLQSLCLQICEVYGIESPAERVLNNFADIVQYLSTLLDKVSQKDRPLLILLDSLDQLSSVDRAYSLTWLPKSLPPNVHIVVSTLPEEFDLLKTLKRTVRSDRSYIQVPTLSEQVGSEILDTWLARVQRCLTEKQREVILSAFSHCRQPLFLKLAFDEARRWKSYTPESELRIAQSARAAINLLYERLEVQHGTIFVSHTLGYIAAARKGISEHELEDVLSLDDEVLDDVYQYWSPPNKDVVRIPPLIVTRLKYDIMEYLAERQADGKRVLQLFHRQFIECAQERYLAGDNSRARHHILADFFLGTWSNGRRKEITMDVSGKREYYNADRNVVPQPDKYDHNVFNRRKLNEVTFHLLRAGRMDDIFQHTLGNLDFMNVKIEAFGVKSLVEDYNMVLQVYNNLEIRLLRDALRLIKPTLEFKGGVPSYLALELIGRLVPFERQSRPIIDSLLEQSRAWCKTFCDHVTRRPFLLPHNTCIYPPGGPLRTTLAHHRAGITSIAMTPDGGYMVTAARDCTIRIYENESDVMELERTLTGHTGRSWNWREHSRDTQVGHGTGENTHGHTAAIEVVCAAPNNELLVSGSLDNTLKVWNLETGRLVITMEEDHAHYRHRALLTTTRDSRRVVSPAGNVVNVWDIESGKLQFTLKGHEGAVSCLAVSLDNQYIITGAEDNSIKMWSTETGELRNTFSPHTGHLTCLKVTQNGRIVSGSKDTTLSVIDMESGEVVHRLEGHSHPVYSLAITSDGKYGVSGSDRVVKLWDLCEGREIRHMQGHYGIVDCVAVTSDNKVILSGARDEHLNVWDFGSGQLVQTLDGQAAKITAMEVTGHIVVTVSTDSYYTKVWDVLTSFPSPECNAKIRG